MQTTFEKIKSRRVLDPVIEELNLTKILAEQAAGRARLRPAEAQEILSKMIYLRQSRNTSLLEIGVYSADPAVSAQIASKIAEVARRLEAIEVIDSASPVARPIRPNVVLNILIGAVASILGSSLAAAARLAFRALGPVSPARIGRLEPGHSTAAQDVALVRLKSKISATWAAAIAHLLR